MNDVFTLNPLLSPPREKGEGGGLFISSPFEKGGLNINIDRGLIWEGVLFNLETTMVSVLRKELEAQVQDVLGHAAEDQNETRPSSW